MDIDRQINEEAGYDSDKDGVQSPKLDPRMKGN